MLLSLLLHECSERIGLSEVLRLGILNARTHAAGPWVDGVWERIISLPLPWINREKENKKK